MDRKCPVCLNASGGECAAVPATNPPNDAYDCQVCGRYELTTTATGMFIRQQATLTPMQRAVFSHRIRSLSLETHKLPIVTSEFIDQLKLSGVLPTPAVQALNAIRYIGDYVQTIGQKVPHLQPALSAIIGAPSAALAGDLVTELLAQGLVDGHKRLGPENNVDILEANLTLSGWQQYESEKRGGASGKYGFLALEFGDTSLDAFVTNILKPGIKEAIGYDVFDMRDVAAAGIIDNLMRARIRDAAFVLADLTHGNPGAYWEAGYAEGLGKQVIYLCEKKKFEVEKTHFDTNHCTTVPWSENEPEQFMIALVSTLRRSLNLFS